MVLHPQEGSLCRTVDLWGQTGFLSLLPEGFPEERSVIEFVARQAMLFLECNHRPGRLANQRRDEVDRPTQVFKIDSSPGQIASMPRYTTPSVLAFGKTRSTISGGSLTAPTGETSTHRLGLFSWGRRSTRWSLGPGI